jgi:aryl-alcohol dehydrogenase-like predicted oxidoreductase
VKYHQLGISDLEVSEIALGTMTFGQQNTLAEACSQLDYAAAHGVNFIDTAEMYPVPAKADTQGRTEEYVGNWLQKQSRDKMIISTKVAGPARGMSWIRNGPESLSRENITSALNGSLHRLNTDYVDLYQIHWPARNVPMFGQSNYNPDLERTSTSVEEQLYALSDLVKSGKVRYVGVSNETPWGVAEFIKIAERLGLPRIVTIQNPYNLINRTYEIALYEMCYREKVSLLAYSPLAFGLLTGKYIKNAQVQGRMTLYPGFGQRYNKPSVPAAVAAYVQLAEEHGVSPAQMALSYLRSRPFVASTIIGATTMEQLEENLTEVVLEAEVLKCIEEIHLRYSNPAP